MIWGNVMFRQGQVHGDFEVYPLGQRAAELLRHRRDRASRRNYASTQAIV